MNTSLKSLNRSLKKALRLIKLPPNLNVWQWAESNRYLSREYTSQPQLYRTSFAPFQKGPQESIHDNDVQLTVIMCASQLMKTVILENVIGFHIDQDPAPILVVQPTIEMAEAWSKSRFTPTIRDSPALNKRIANNKSRDSGNTILVKQFIGGDLAVVGANAPSGLAMRPRRVVLLDEIDRYPASAGTEGDPCALAIRRAESFWNSVIVMTSTPTTKGSSRIESEFELTDKQHWFCPCPKCGHFQTLRWPQVKWPDGKPEEAFYECELPECLHQWTDTERHNSVMSGEWRSTAPFKGKRGFFLNGIASPFKARKGFKGRLHQMVVGFLDAKSGGNETLKTWVNTFLAETWEEGGEVIDPTKLITRCEDYGDKLPDGVLVLTMGADVQKDRIEAEIVGWGEGEECWGIQRGIFIGNTDQQPVWDSLYDFLNREFDHPSGARLTVQSACVDAGFRSKAALAFVMKSSPKFVYAIKGASNRLLRPVMVPKRPSRAAVYQVDTAEFKTAIYSRLKIVEPGPRYLHFPRGRDYDDEFFAQLTAEKVRTTFKNGHPQVIWDNVRSNKRNEALDIRVYNHAALYLRRPNFAGLLKNIAKKPAAGNISKTDTTEQISHAPKPKAEPERQQNPFRPPAIFRPPGRKGWLGGFR